MLIQVVHSHPLTDSYNHALFRIIVETLQERLNESGADLHGVPVVSILVLIASMSRGLMLEKSIGMETGLAETEAAIERLLDELDGAVAADKA